MRSVLQSLKEYQDVLIRIAELDRLLSMVPPDVENLGKEWNSIKDRITQLTTRQGEQQTQLKEKQTALGEANIKAKKFEEDLHQVTNTREYHAALKEIDGAKKLIHTLQESVTARQTELKEIETNLEECSQLEAESRSRYDEAMTRLKESQKEHQIELGEKKRIRDAVAQNIPPRIMKQFERIAMRRNGVGLAICINSVCTACNVRVRQNVVDELRKFKRLISCESCKRILLFGDQE
ncbi:MAG: hypothetical protein QNK37_08565 [Acidobacteriota bacterium]|nr:hypothetical protein [Acidobacteriota bacterium]